MALDAYPAYGSGERNNTTKAICEPITGWRVTRLSGLLATCVDTFPATPVPGAYRQSNDALSISGAATTYVALPSALPASSLHVWRAGNSAPGTACRPVLPRRRRTYRAASLRRHKDPRSTPRCSPHPGRRADRGQSSSGWSIFPAGYVVQTSVSPIIKMH